MTSIVYDPNATGRTFCLENGQWRRCQGANTSLDHAQANRATAPIKPRNIRPASGNNSRPHDLCRRTRYGKTPLDFGTDVDNFALLGQMEHSLARLRAPIVATGFPQQAAAHHQPQRPSPPCDDPSPTAPVPWMLWAYPRKWAILNRYNNGPTLQREAVRHYRIDSTGLCNKRVELKIGAREQAVGVIGPLLLSLLGRRGVLRVGNIIGSLGGIVSSRVV